MIAVSPADILRDFLYAQAYVTMPDEAGVWPCFTNSLPDTDVSIHDAIVLYDDIPEKDGRLMNTGTVILHYAIFIRLRSLVYNEGWKKANEIATLLDSIVNETVGSYQIKNATRRMGVDFSGLDSQHQASKRRFVFDTKYVLTLM